MANRLSIILETIEQIVAEEVLTGKAAMKKAAEAKGRKGKGKLPSKGKIKRLEAKAAERKEIEELEKAD
jgi:hypothetical protein